MPPRKTRPISDDDLYRLQTITDCQISPDGEHVIFSLLRVDRKTEKKYSNLWLVPAQGGRARQFTYGDQVDSRPRWSPDGQQIAFLSDRKDEKQAQIYLIPFDGGEARPLTDLKGSFAGYEWSPDGRQLVCQFRKKDRQEIEREGDEQKRKLGIVSRHITRVFYKLDETGFLPQERWHVWLVDTRNGRARQLTGGEIYDELDACWSPDGQQIVFCSNRSPDPDMDPYAVDVYLMPASGGEMRKIEAPYGEKWQPSFSPDGKWISYFARVGRGDWWKNAGLWIVPADGSGEARNLTDGYDLHVDCMTINDVGSPTMTPPTWSRDSRRIFFQTVFHGNTQLRSVTTSGEDMQVVVDGKGVVGTFNFDAAHTNLCYFYGRMDDPCQVFVQDTSSGRARQITRVNAGLLRGIDLGSVEEVWFKGKAGNDLQGWILKPPAFDASRRYPSILEIHGGPLVQYGNFFMHEFYFLAARGYVVYFCNPRGGQGYGEQHARAIWNAWGQADYEDLLCWADYVAGMPYIDPDRMGVTGGSYGGFMTNWIIGHTQRFKAAVTQRSVSNQVSLWGSSDYNWMFQMETGGDKPPWENVDHYWDLSPLKYVGNVRTPTLIIHSENDLRCAFEQGEQIYVALKNLGVDTEFIVFPEESHGLSRIGRTDRRIERLLQILRWFNRYLKPE